MTSEQFLQNLISICSLGIERMAFHPPSGAALLKEKQVMVTTSRELLNND